jgi:hypothetical protein
MIPPLVFLGLAGLALINVVVPLSILKLATRRRVWGVRLLMALPVVVAIPLAAFLAIESVTPSMAGLSVERAILIIMLSTLGGLPVVVYAALIGSSLLRRRWLRFAVLAFLTLLASFALGAYWLGSDLPRMPAIEHYTWSEWYGVIFPGAYAVGVLASIAWVLRCLSRMMRRLVRRIAGVSAVSS